MQRRRLRGWSQMRRTACRRATRSRACASAARTAPACASRRTSPAASARCTAPPGSASARWSASARTPPISAAGTASSHVDYVICSRPWGPASRISGVFVRAGWDTFLLCPWRNLQYINPYLPSALCINAHGFTYVADNVTFRIMQICNSVQKIIPYFDCSL